MSEPQQTFLGIPARVFYWLSAFAVVQLAIGIHFTTSYPARVFYAILILGNLYNVIALDKA